jgi:hypothetical protein
MLYTIIAEATEKQYLLLLQADFFDNFIDAALASSSSAGNQTKKTSGTTFI